MPNDDDDVDDAGLEARVEAAEASWQDVQHGRPDGHLWGFFSYGDAPGAIGGGIGSFVWFMDRESMLRFIATTLPYSPPGKAALDPDQIAVNTEAVVAQLQAGTISDSEGIVQLNPVLRTCSQITWMGTVDDLLHGDHPYALEVRQAFRDDDENEPTGEPVRDAEREDFFDFLEEWGF